MFIKLVFFVVLACTATSRHAPRYADLDEDDQILFRAAYETPSYDHHQEYEEDEEISPGKLDLLKDGMWSMKAKIKEMKTFHKALAANLLATKLQLKELVANQLKSLKKLHHVEIDKKKPVYTYQNPPSTPSYHYEPQHYTAPAPPIPHYGVSQYEPPQYVPPQPQYEPPQYIPPQPQYVAPQYHDPYYGN